MSVSAEQDEADIVWVVVDDYGVGNVASEPCDTQAEAVALVEDDDRFEVYAMTRQQYRDGARPWALNDERGDRSSAATAPTPARKKTTPAQKKTIAALRDCADARDRNAARAEEIGARGTAAKRRHSANLDRLLADHLEQTGREHPNVEELCGCTEFCR